LPTHGLKVRGNHVPVVDRLLDLTRCSRITDEVGRETERGAGV
jgi:hypothetical protein